jgi:solute:Na+ symporter, SSS family
MWAISVTDFIQSILIIVGLVVLAVLLTIKAGGIGVVIDSAPKETFRFAPHPDLKSILSYVAAWCVLGLGSIPSQDVFQRSMSSRSANVAVLSCYIGGVLYLIFALLPLFISLCTKHLYPDQFSNDTQVALPNMVLEHTGLPVQILFFGSLLSAIMSTTSSSILAPASIFSENLIKPLFGHKIKDETFLLITKLCVVFFSVIASVMACMRSNIYELVGESSILSLVSLFIPMTMGLYWKKANSRGAVSSMFAGIIAWVIFEWAESSIPALLPATVISLAAMVVGSLLPQKQVRH